MTGFLTPTEHLDSGLEVVKLLLARHIAATWPRLVNAAGALTDLFVSIPEVRCALFPERFPPDASSVGLPSVEAVDELLTAAGLRLGERVADSAIDLPIENVRALVGLEPVELLALLTVVAIQIDPTTARLATHAWSDFTMKQPTLGFVAELCARTPNELARVLAVADGSHALRRLRLLETSKSDRWRDDTPAGSLGLRVPDRVVAYLRGEPAPLQPDVLPGALDGGADAWLRLSGPLDPSLSTIAAVVEPFHGALRLAHRGRQRHVGGGRAPVLGELVPVVVLTGPSPDDALDLCRVAFGGSRAVLEVDLTAAHRQSPLTDLRADKLLGLAFREALLIGAQPLLQLRDLLADAAAAGPILSALRRIAPVWREELVLHTTDISRSMSVLLGPVATLPLLPAPPAARLAVWRAALGDAALARDDVSRIVDELAHRHALPGRAIRDTVAEAQFQATMRRALSPRASADLLAGDVAHALRGQVQHRLGAVAEPFSTQLGWADFQAPEELRDQLGEVISWARHHRRVHEDWGFGRISGYGRGLTVLLAGPPGTGKTFAAALIAKDLGAELYRVDLSRMVDKYIGETEKNLARLFDEAERSGAIILFDEADSLFAKRTQVTSSNDRYANLEVNYLLQRMEHFEGTTILTTNFAENLDEAFKRRIKFRLTFAMPSPAERAILWRGMLPSEAPIAGRIDFDRLAQRFELAPAYIKSCVVRAAFRAAQLERPIDDELLFAAARAEYRELGRIVRED
jgi:hypothetical protein